MEGGELKKNDAGEIWDGIIGGLTFEKEKSVGRKKMRRRGMIALCCTCVTIQAKVVGSTRSESVIAHTPITKCWPTYRGSWPVGWPVDQQVNFSRPIQKISDPPYLPAMSSYSAFHARTVQFTYIRCYKSYIYVTDVYYSNKSPNTVRDDFILSKKKNYN